MDDLVFFCRGFLGSITGEILLIYTHYQKGPSLPKRYTQKGFWIVRLLLALAAGGLVVAYEVSQPLLSFHIGVSSILLIQKFNRLPKNFDIDS